MASQFAISSGRTNHKKEKPSHKFIKPNRPNTSPTSTRPTPNQQINHKTRRRQSGRFAISSGRTNHKIDVLRGRRSQNCIWASPTRPRKLGFAISSGRTNHKTNFYTAVQFATQTPVTNATPGKCTPGSKIIQCRLRFSLRPSCAFLRWGFIICRTELPALQSVTFWRPNCRP